MDNVGKIRPLLKVQDGYKKPSKLPRCFSFLSSISTEQPLHLHTRLRVPQFPSPSSFKPNMYATAFLAAAAAASVASAAPAELQRRGVSARLASVCSCVLFDTLVPLE